MDPNRSSESAPEARFESAVPLDLLPLHSTNLLTVLDEHGIVRYESPSIERIYGFDQEALVGDNVAEYFHPDDRADVVSAFRTVVTSEEYTAEAVEYRHRQADGTYLWVESVASANPTPEGYYVVNTRDISDRKRREQHLQHANERLEAFVSVVSHDLRNPLSVAEGRLRLAQTECECDHLDDVANAHARMDALIEDLLSRAQTDRPLAAVEPVSLARLSEDCWQTVVTADATLVVETERRLHADPNRLKQLLENLFRNAIEHAGERPTVTVGELETGFYLEDDGPGIPPTDRGRLFDAGTSSAPEGTGLGLSIVERIVDAHDWRIDIADGTSGGARFEIKDVEFAR